MLSASEMHKLANESVSRAAYDYAMNAIERKIKECTFFGNTSFCLNVMAMSSNNTLPSDCLREMIKKTLHEKGYTYEEKHIARSLWFSVSW